MTHFVVPEMSSLRFHRKEASTSAVAWLGGVVEPGRRCNCQQRQYTCHKEQEKNRKELKTTTTKTMTTK
jgi:hypothetical protein